MRHSKGRGGKSHYEQKFEKSDNSCVISHCGYYQPKWCMPREIADNETYVIFGHEGSQLNYVYENDNLAEHFDADIVLVDTAPDNVTGGTFVNAEPVITQTYETNVEGYQESYTFQQEGWNAVRNASFTSSGEKTILVKFDNFVQVDADLSQVRNDAEVRILDAKRSFTMTGCGDDTVTITSASNENSWNWSTTHRIDTGAGDDVVNIYMGDSDLLDTTIVQNVMGNASVEANLGRGNDKFITHGEVMTKDYVYGGAGNDFISTGNNDDVIEGGEDNACIFEICDDFYWLLAGGDKLVGGEGADTFIYNTYESTSCWGKQKTDGFDHILDFSDEDVLVLNLQDGDVVETQEATVGTFGGFHTGTMVTINGEASVFLENYTNASEIFV